MKLTPADKLALMMTSAWSQRALADYIGASHQQVGRWLRGERVNDDGVIVNTPRDAQVRRNIDAAFTQYKRAVIDASKAQGLPYSRSVPVAMRRLIAEEDYRPLDIKAGEPGFRAVAEHTQYINDEVRELLMSDLIDSDELTDVSMGSWVDLADYMKQADERVREEYRRKGIRRTEKQIEHRKKLQRRLDRGVQRVRIFSPHANAMTKRRMPDAIARDVTRELRQRHAPAAEAPRTRLADQLLVSTKHRPKPERIKLREQQSKAAPDDRKTQKPQAPKTRTRRAK